MEFSPVNTAWVLIAAALVFFMQAGFAILESGLTRAKNAGNIIMKNLMDFCIGTPIYWFVGFGIMFGTGSLVGGIDLFTRGDYSAVTPDGVPFYAFFIFQTVFCATAATIVSGAVGIFVFGGLGVAVAPVLIYHIMGYTERMAIVLSKVPTSDILVMTLGIGIGLILANLLGGPFSHLPIIGPYIPLIFSLVLSIIGAKVALRKHKDIVGFFNRSIPSLKGAVKPAAVKSLALSDRLYSKNKLLDTSVIIDGRIIDILKTGFLEGRLIVPNFVLEELQKLADSSDNLKRAKGRRGLDLIQEIQQKNKEQLLVEDTDFEDLNEVDAKLVKLAKQTEAVIITNDFNLNKVAEIQGVSVLNINDLANAIKPVVLPGEEMNVFVVKDGKENNQGVAYLEDGTMIVVEGGKKLVGENLSLIHI